MNTKVYILCHSDGSFVYNVGCLLYAYNERRGAENKLREYQRRHQRNYDNAVKDKTKYGRGIPEWASKPFDWKIVECEVIL